MFTIFSVPKPFCGHVGMIQENAIRTWATLDAGPEVILFGDEEGTAEAADRLGVRHEPELGCSESGTPLASDLFERAQRLATHDWLCYANCDIILMSDLSSAIRRVSRMSRPILMSGRRWRVEVGSPLDVEPGWESRWRQHLATKGERDSVQCMDYFVFARGLIPKLPDLALGRTRWDSYLPFATRARGAIFVDATDCVMAAHQNHDYAAGDGKAGMRNSAEAARNRELAGAGKCTLGNASHKLTKRGLQRAIDDVRLRYWVFSQWRRPYAGLPVRLVLKRYSPRAKALLVK